MVYALGVIHTLGAGTDARSPWSYRPIALMAPAIGAMFWARVAHGIRKGRERRRAAAERRRERRQERPERPAPRPRPVLTGAVTEESA